MPLDSVPLRPVTLAILAGGEGSRMGQPKAHLRLHGRPILEYLLDQFAWPGATLLVTAPGREKPPGWERFEREVSDPVAGSGPLRGVMTALESIATPLVAIASVDMPRIGVAHLAWLIEQLMSRPDLLGVMGRRSGEEGEQIEPFPCVFRREAKEWVAGQMEKGIRSAYRLSQSGRVAAIEVPADWAGSMWANLNLPEDVAAYEARSLFPSSGEDYALAATGQP